MKKNEIINQLKDSFSDVNTLQLLAEYVEEFQMLLGKYISTDEIIKRLKNNILSNFEYRDELINGVLDGQYDIENKKVIICKNEKSNQDYIKFVLFHELTHAITTKELKDGRKIMGFSFIEQSYGKGLNEAMTEWLSFRRNEMLNQKHDSGYDIIVEQIKILAQIIGEDELIKCYLYEPENLKELLRKNNIDFDRLDMLYQIILNNRTDIYRLANGKMLENVTNYNLYKECQEINDIYCNALGTVCTIEDFEKKYSILCSYKDSTFNINNIISNQFYVNIYKDIIKLLNKGYNIKDIENTIRSLGINISKINQSIKYNNILDQEKNKAIVSLYESYCKNESDYKNFAYDNYSILYDKFSKDNFIPNEFVLYDVNRYFVLGKFLSQHPEYDYDELSVEHLKFSNNISTYKIQPFNKNEYIYTIPLLPVEKKNNNSFEITLANNKKMIVTIENGIVNIEASKEEPVRITGAYYLESQLESFEYRIKDEQLEESKRKYYKEKYDFIMKKIIKRENGKII